VYAMHMSTSEVTFVKYRHRVEYVVSRASEGRVSD